MTTTKIQPKIEDGECATCGVPEDEICQRCGCDCGHGKGGLKNRDEYCSHGCKTAHGDGEKTWAEDQARQQQLEQWAR